MSQPITIEIPGPPIAKKRPRFARIGKGVRTYNCQETEEGRWLLFARQQVHEMLEGPVWMRITFFMPRPKSHYGTGRNARKLKDSAPEHHTSKPDLDNLEKFAKDCLNGLAWKDDAQVCEVIKHKRYSDNPKTIITIQEIE